MKNNLLYYNLSVEDAIELDRPLWRLLAVSRATHWKNASQTMMMMIDDVSTKTQMEKISGMTSDSLVTDGGI